MVIAVMNSVLEQMQSTALKASGASSEGISGGVDFSGQLQLVLNKISASQTAARTQARDFEMGKPDIALNDVMVNMQKSSIALQLGIQVRNKLVSAYSDIMNMQV